MAWRRRIQIVGLVALIAACGRQAFVGLSLPGGGSPSPSPTVPPTPTPTPVQDIGDWAFHSQISVSGANLGSSLSGFPVPVVIKQGAVTGALSAGADLRFFDSNLTPLPYEIELWNTAAQSVVWVLSPQIEEKTGTAFQMYWGNPNVSDAQTPAAVWSSAGFAAVWHLGGLSDSTSLANDLTVNDAPTATGLFGLGRSFDGTGSQYLSAPDKPSLDPTLGLTISAWVNAVKWTGNNRIVEKGTNDSQYRFSRQQHNTGFPLFINYSPIELSVKNVGEADNGHDYDTTAAWVHLACTYDGHHMTVYIDGQQVAQNGQNGKLPTTTDPFYIGTKQAGDGTSSDSFDGIIDEVRFSPMARSADWILAEYEAGAGTLVTVGPASP